MGLIGVLLCDGWGCSSHLERGSQVNMSAFPGQLVQKQYMPRQYGFREKPEEVGQGQKVTN